jgi:glutaredoxin 3
MSVVLYSTPSCRYCVMAENFLRQQKIPFQKFDVSRDQRRAEEMMRKSGQTGVPVLDVRGKILVGFRQDDILSAYRR